MSKPYPYMLPTEKHFFDYIQANNIKTNSRIVFYDTKHKMTFWATRAFYMFSVFGFKNISVLNGGLHKWTLEERVTEADPDFGSVEDYKVTLNQDMVRSYEQICEIEKKIEAKETDIQILDARGEQYYEAGHIPVSKNHWYQKFLNGDTNSAKSPAEILKIAEDNGIDISKPIISSCGGGISATYNFACLTSAGVKNIALYDGAWSEYSARKKAEQEKK